MSIAQNFPALKPSLNLDFANVKALDPRITFARASAGVYYDGVTTTKAEENLLLQSQDFTTSWTNVSLTITANSTVAPDGTTTADTVTRATSGEISQSPTVVSGLTYTMSVFAKADTSDFLQIVLDVGGFTVNDWANFNLSTGAVGNKGASATASIQDIGGGYYRCVLTCTAVATQSASFAFCPLDADTNSRKPNNTVSASNILWGAQLEQRSAITAYTPTTSQPITNYIPVLQTASANVARFDHDPVTGESLGLLVEEQRTNLLTYSEDFAAWTKSNATVTANTVVAPDGTLTGDKLITNNAASNGQVFQSLSKSASAITYTFTVYAKAGDWNTVGIYISDSANFSNRADIIVNLATGVISSAAASRGTFTSGSGSIIDVGNGWYKVALTFTTSTETVLLNRVYSLDSVAATGDGYSGIYIWGAQLEAGAFPTSYISTSASQVTRSADSASMTGTNFTSIFNPAEYSVYAEASFISASTVNQPVVNIDSATATTDWLALGNGLGGGGGNRWRLWTLPSADILLAVNNTIPLNNTPYKAAYAFAFNNAALSAGGQTVTDTSCKVIPILDRLRIGAYQYGSFSGRVQKIALYPARLSNEQLQALTS